jgi:fructose-1,6-bisphosphatase/inositol monophosphatase family enzyme
MYPAWGVVILILLSIGLTFDYKLVAAAYLFLFVGGYLLCVSRLFQLFKPWSIFGAIAISICYIAVGSVVTFLVGALALCWISPPCG